MFFETTYNEGLGQNPLPSDPRERERQARLYSGVTVTPGGRYAPIPFYLPDGSTAVSRRARTGPTAVFDPWNDVVRLLNADGSPGEAYSWPVVLSADGMFISPGSAPGFPVRDFFCGFHPGICDQLVRAEKRLGPNPCWGKSSGTCDPRQYAQDGGPTSTETQRLLQQPGLTRASGEISLPGFILPKVPATDVRPLPAPVESGSSPSAAAPVSPGSDLLARASSALGLPSQIDLFGYKLNPVAAGLGVLAAWYLFLRK